MESKIFILEDSEDLSYILQTILEDEGYAVEAFLTVKELQEAIQLQIPDLFLLDVMLPDGDGITVCNQIKDSELTKHVPVLIMSAHFSVESFNTVACADGYISKPFDLNHVVTFVHTFFMHKHDSLSTG